MKNITLHKGDLPAGLELGREIAVDTEAMGLNLTRDALCVVQLSSGDGTAYVVQLERGYDCPNLKALLSDTQTLKIFHFARFDVAALASGLGIGVDPLFCTKVGSRLARTYTPRHGLKDLVMELVGVELDKGLDLDHVPRIRVGATCVLEGFWRNLNLVTVWAKAKFHLGKGFRSMYRTGVLDGYLSLYR